MVTGSEQCDDGNLVDGDGCDTNCTNTSCGNGILTAGEVCDDGNLINGDGCSSACAIEPQNLLPGGGSPATECYSEFLTNPPPPWKAGKIGKVLQGTASGDHTCTFDVVQCFNLLDPRYPECVASDVWRIDIKSPRDSDRVSQAEADNRGRLNASYVGAAVFGHCTAPPDVVGDFCTEDASCDSDSPGKCGPLAMEFTPPITAGVQCVHSFEMKVPLKQSKTGAYKKGSATLAVTVHPTNDPLTGKAGKDTDKIKFVCVPAP